MRKLGMYSPEIKRDTMERLFDAIHVYGFEEVQFDFLSVGPEQMPAKINDDTVKRIYQAASVRGIAISAVNGTFNMTHPSAAVRREGLARFQEIARVSKGLDCPLITLCTGSRNTQRMWVAHSDNDTPEAWADLLQTTREAVQIADDFDVDLGIEIEASNVVDTAEKALALIETIGSRRLKIIFDPANLFHLGDCRSENAIPILEHAFGLLKQYITIAHGKDMLAGPRLDFTSAGRGIVAFERMLELLNSIGYKGAIIAHGIYPESDFPFSVAFLKSLMEKEE